MEGKTEAPIVASAEESTSRNRRTGQEILEESGESEGSSNPAQLEYYKSQARKNNSITTTLNLIKFLGPIIATIVLGLVGLYFWNLREPIIRLEEKFTNLKEDVEKNSSTIEELKRVIFSEKPVEQKFTLPNK